MTNWNDLPHEIHIQILREYCKSLVFDYSRYHAKFHPDAPFARVLRHTYPPPLINYLNALLTCRDFHHCITNEIKLLHDRSPRLTLQDVQYKMLLRYSGMISNEGAGDYREIALAQAMLGCFWKNPFICGEYSIFDDLFLGFEETGRLLLVCLLEGVLDMCKKPVTSSDYIRVKQKAVDGSFHELIFTQGSYLANGDCFCFESVSGWKKVKEHTSQQEYRDNGGDKIGLLPHVPQPGEKLPYISASERDTWWLGKNIGGDDAWNEWYLVNYKEKKVFVGPEGQPAEWPLHIDLKELHIWQPNWLEVYYDGDGSYNFDSLEDSQDSDFFFDDGGSEGS
jgi:hypothetical protein